MTYVQKTVLPVTLGSGAGEAPPTAADAWLLLEGCPDLTPKERQTYVGAIRALVRICCPEISRKERNRAVLLERAATVPMDCAHLNERFYRRSPAACGLTRQRYGNIGSLVRDVLRRLGRHAEELPCVDGLLPDWQALHAPLSSERRRGMIAFMGYCTREGITPAQVTTQTLLTFREWSAAWTLHRDPHGRARRAASNWNWANRHVAGWPATRLTLPSMRDEYTLPFEAYPAAFQRDVEAYLEGLACRGEQELFPDDVARPRIQGPRSRSPRSRRQPLSERTIETRRYQIRQAAAALVASGHPPESLETLRDLVQPTERVRSILMFHRRRTLERRRIDDAGGEAGQQRVVRTQNLAGIGEVLRQIALFHCGLPEDGDEFTRIRAWSSSVTPEQQVTMTEKNTHRLRGLMEPRTYAALLHYPATLMKWVASCGQGTATRGRHRELKPRDAALTTLYAVVMEILIICPLRRDNLARLRLDRHLHRARPGGPITHIHLSGPEVKNREAVDWPIPPESAQLIETYLRQHRPHLADPGNPFLFPGRGPRCRAAHDIAVGLTERIKQDIGAAFNMHIMRHMAVLRYLRRHPGQYEIVRRVLGHKSVKTTIAYYAGLEVAAAAESFHALIASDRKDTRLLVGSAFGKAPRRGGRGR
jgi:hypothetical protein